MEIKEFNENGISEQEKEPLQSGTGQEVSKETKTKVKHFTTFTTEKTTENVYGYTWNKVVNEYLRTGYKEESNQKDITVLGVAYKVLKRGEVTVFYDADGNTLFDVENERLKEEYEYMEETEAVAEPQSEMGKVISGIEQQALEHAVNNDIDTDEVIPMGTASLKEIVEGIPASTAEEIEAAKENNNSSVYIGVVGAVTKLQEELKNAKDKTFANPVIEHLIERCKESESLASDVCQDHKTWNKCFKYIYEQARKQIKGSSGAVRDEVVYEWAEDYYHKDDRAEEEKKAKEAAERKKKQEERAKKAKAEPQKAKAPKPKEEPKPKKNSRDMDGQLDLFSMMGI